MLPTAEPVSLENRWVRRAGLWVQCVDVTFLQTKERKTILFLPASHEVEESPHDHVRIVRGTVEGKERRLFTTDATDDDTIAWFVDWYQAQDEKVKGAFEINPPKL